MARVALEIPKVGLVMENARLVRWLKSVGDTVNQGEPLLELETEKSVVEIESTETGRLVEILLHADQEAHVGDRIAWLEDGKPERLAAQSAAAPQSTPAPIRPSPRSMSAPGEQDARRVRSSPAARRLAALHGLDLSQVSGTGPRGRVQLADIDKAMGAGLEESSPRGTAPGVRPLSNRRRALVRSVTLSNATVPQFCVGRSVDWSALQAVRAGLQAQQSGPSARLPLPSVNDFLLHAIARTLQAIPDLNAIFAAGSATTDPGIVPVSGTHVGLIVAVDDGLIIPVFHDLESCGLIELARRRADVVQRALSGKLRREELEGATFSLSNLGARGPDRFTAIVSPPQSAILAVGRQRECVVAIDGEVQIRPRSDLTLTVDHRIADGRLAADFLAAVVTVLEGDAWPLN